MSTDDKGYNTIGKLWRNIVRNISTVPFYTFVNGSNYC